MKSIQICGYLNANSQQIIIEYTVISKSIVFTLNVLINAYVGVLKKTFLYYITDRAFVILSPYIATILVIERKKNYSIIFEKYSNSL